MRKSGTASNAIRYAGYRYDVETGLYYLNARMYNPHTGRFLQADTYAGRLSDPLSLNLYTYCLNNPTRYVDPSGHFGVIATFLLGAAITGLISGTINAGMEAFSEHFLEKRDKLSFRELGFEFAEGFLIGAISGGIGAVGSVGLNAASATAKFGADAAKSTFVKFCAKTVAKKTARSIVKRALLAGVGGAAESAFMDTGHRLLQGEKVTARSVLWSAFSGALFNQVGEFAPDVIKKAGKARNAKKARKLLGDKLSFEDFLSANAKPYEFLEKYNIPTTLSLEERKLLDELDVKMMLKQDVGEGALEGGGKKVKNGNTSPNTLGKQGENFVSQKLGLPHNSTPMNINGKSRIPDFIDLDQGIIAESKNVASLSYTKQLHDYVDKATEMGTKLELFVRQNTKLSKTLQDAIDKGLINLNYFSW